MSVDPLTTFPVRSVGGVPFNVTDLQRATRWLLHDAAPHRRPVNIRLANAFNVALADQDSSYKAILCNDGVNFPDGSPVVWFLNLQSGSKASRVRGPSFLVTTLENSSHIPLKHYFLGSTPKTLTALSRSIRTKYPDVQIAGHHAPPFAPIDEEFLAGCVEAVHKADADIIWLGLGTPKQDQLGGLLALRLQRPVINVGAAFDFMAGTAREAPRWVQRSGFEWLFRLVSEPRRLWKRYAFGNVRFLKVALRDLRKIRTVAR